MTVPSLLIENVSKTYRVRASRAGSGSVVAACRNIDLAVQPGEIVAVVGESGSGKSTLAKIAAWIELPDEGTVHVGGQDLRTLGSAELRAARSRFQMIPQDYRAALDPRWPVRRILAQPFAIHGLGDWASVDEAVRSLLHEVDLPQSLVNRRAQQLSGGQCQRLCIARAMALRPSVVIADEALSGLDVTTQVQVVDLIRRLRTEFRTAFVLVSHDLRTVERLADRVAVMQSGEVVEVATTAELFSHPRHDYTRALLSSLLPVRFGDGPDEEETTR